MVLSEKYILGMYNHFIILIIFHDFALDGLGSTMYCLSIAKQLICGFQYNYILF